MGDMALLSLVMVVKNEAKTIAKTIESCKGLVDLVEIYDTGSEDYTLRVATWACKSAGLPYHVRSGEFRDYSTARNHALDCCSSTWALMLSGREHVADAMGGLLHSLLRHGARESAAHVMINQGDLRFLHPRITRTGGGARYFGATHEQLLAPSFADCSGALLVENAGRLRTPEHLARDLDLLGADHTPRGMFYRAQTLQEMTLFPAAVAAYAQVVSGDPNYVYEARLRIGQLDNGDLAEMALDRAIGMRASRPEGHFCTGELRIRKGDWGSARGYFQRARSAALTPQEQVVGIVHRSMWDLNRIDAKIDECDYHASALTPVNGVSKNGTENTSS